MPRAISITSPITGNYSPFSLPGRADNAVSPEAEHLNQVTDSVRNSLEDSEALYGNKRAAINELEELAAECAESNWDGEGASPVDPWAVRTARRFIRVLPAELPLPEFAPEPDGAISLDWIYSRRRLVSVSVGPTIRLACAWLNGTDTGHAVVTFDGETVPQLIRQQINEIKGDV